MIPDYFSGHDRDARRWSYMAVSALLMGILGFPVILGSVVSSVPSPNSEFWERIVFYGAAAPGVVFPLCVWGAGMRWPDRIRGSRMAFAGLIMGLVWLMGVLCLDAAVGFGPDSWTGR